MLVLQCGLHSGRVHFGIWTRLHASLEGGASCVSLADSAVAFLALVCERLETIRVDHRISVMCQYFELDIICNLLVR